jgi:hypothetical protein
MAKRSIWTLGKISITIKSHIEQYRAVHHRHTYGYGMAIIQYGYHTIGPFSGHLMVWLWYGIVPY